MSEKYLRVMADYSSSGLWNKDGANVNVEEYNLSPETVLALALWCELYEYNNDYLDESDPKRKPFDYENFSNMGFLVASMIKKDLPDYEIIYFDDLKCSESTDREDRIKYEYPLA